MSAHISGPRKTCMGTILFPTKVFEKTSCPCMLIEHYTEKCKVKFSVINDDHVMYQSQSRAEALHGLQLTPLGHTTLLETLKGHSE